MAGFTKLFNSILYSTIWQEPKETKILWITMLAMADSRGEVQASIPGLAKTAGITIHECESAIATLSSPDPYSRTPDHEGRRIESVDGGWRLLNHGKYRALLSAEERKEYNRRKQAEFRAARAAAEAAARKAADSVNDMSMTVNDNKQCQHSTEAEAEAVRINKKPASVPPVELATAISRGEQIGLTKDSVERWYAMRSRDGWEISKNNGSTVMVTKENWQHDLATVKGWRVPNQPNGHHHRKNEYPQETLELP